MARPQRERQKPNLTPLFAFMGLAIAALLAASFAYKQRNEAATKAREEARVAAQAVEENDNPFADIDTSAPPKRDPSSKPPRARKKFTELGPPTLLTEALWVKATAQAKIAKSLFDEAEKAKSAGRSGEFEQKAVAGREMLDGQLVLTADWEEELFSKYGQMDKVVHQIKGERDRWFKLVNKYRKVGAAGSGD